MKLPFLNIYKNLSFSSRVVIIIFGFLIGVSSLLFTGHMARELRDKERYEVELWAYAMERAGGFDRYDPLYLHIIKSRDNNIPFIITDVNLKVENSNLIPSEVINHPDRLRERIDELSLTNPLKMITASNGMTYYLFYGQSRLLVRLYVFPYIQILLVIVFVLFGYLTLKFSKHDEQNRVWIGLAKETAHQLGTPTSSLLGWIEYLRTQPIDQTTVDEMSKDLTRLLKVVDRFSKIGSETHLVPMSINEIIGSSVLYFRTRAPKNVTIDYNGLAIAPVQANLNEALFEWVVENLLKNALDALQGRGKIDVKISYDNDNIYIDTKDTGKGIASSNFKKIFEPGFTTKTRGWGLGLSLSRRIVEDYHNGKISVVESAIGKGTTIRITVGRVV